LTLALKLPTIAPRRDAAWNVRLRRGVWSRRLCANHHRADRGCVQHHAKLEEIRIMRLNRLPLAVFAAALALPFGVARAQGAPELPSPSPKARLEQRVGLVDFAIDYSSPGVKGRKIWGGLVPYDKPWRAGANAATKLTSSHDFVFAGKSVAAGSYALYAIPGKASWTVALNTSTEAWGNDGFDKKADVARVTVKPIAIAPRERMTFIFANTTDDTTRLDLEWEKVRVPIPIQVDTKRYALANIEKAVDDAWRPQFTSARYLLESGGDLDRALVYADGSIAVKPTWWNNWVRAQILAKKGRPLDAVAAGEKAQQLGTGDRVYEGFFKDEVTKTVATWKKKTS
jgi:hypothetical protein